MIRILVLTLLGLLSACMTLPGSDSPTVSRYLISGPDRSCESGGEPLSLSVVNVNAGLDNDRIARRDANSGEITYLKDVRWADQLGPLLEQQMAKDLECAGFAVLSGHHHRLGQKQMICEARAFNLVQNGRDAAEVYLSCLFYRGKDDQVSLVIKQTADLDRWNADAAVAALSAAYASAMDELISGIR